MKLLSRTFFDSKFKYLFSLYREFSCWHREPREHREPMCSLNFSSMSRFIPRNVIESVERIVFPFDIYWRSD